MKTCGSCYFHRGSGRCKNKNASTYNEIFPADSSACQMRVSSLIKPMGYGVNGITALILIPLQIILMIFGGGGPSSSSNSGNGGFRL
jgi:hypothetical protein